MLHKITFSLQGALDQSVGMDIGGGWYQETLGIQEEKEDKKVTATDQTWLPDVVPFREGGLSVAFLFCTQFFY